MAETTDNGVKATLLEDGAVLRILIDQPKGNILTAAVMDGIRKVLETHRQDQKLRLIFIRGGGGHFSYGASVPEHKKEEAPRMLQTFHGLARELYGFPVPVAALVEGRCLGGAFEVALCCHFVFAAKGAVFGCPEIKLGVFPPVLAAIGAQRLGAAVAERLLLTGADLDVESAERTGWIAKVFEGDVEEALLGWYRDNLGGLSASSLRHALAALRVDTGAVARFITQLDAAEARYLGPLLASHDGNEGIEAFLQKRKPQWSHA